MIGIGKYKVDIDHMFFKGEAVFEIKYDDGKYEFEIEIENADFDIDDIEIVDYTEDVDTLDATAKVSLVPGKPINIHLTFTDTGCDGYLKIPFVGKVKIKDAVKI